MTDPFSVAGSAVGVASLGIRVCQGLISYYQDWKSQDDDIKAAVRSLEDLEQTLELLHSILNKSDHVSTAHAIQLGVKVADGIRELKGILENCQKYTEFNV
jgi:hypothetical protein